VIATPSALHEGQALEVLERGVAVFCQKPLALDAAGAARAQSAPAGIQRRICALRRREGMYVPWCTPPHATSTQASSSHAIASPSKGPPTHSSAPEGKVFLGTFIPSC